MPDKRSDLAVCSAEGDGGIDSHGEGCDSVFEEMADDLHDCRFVLDDSDVWRAVKFSATSERQ